VGDLAKPWPTRWCWRVRTLRYHFKNVDIIQTPKYHT
jgi:hypothetical protein